MGYYCYIDICELKGSKPDDRLDLYYLKFEDGVLEPEEWYLKWSNDFLAELLGLAKLGVKGEVQLHGEEGEHYKLVLEDGEVKEHYGRIVFDENPHEVYRTEKDVEGK